MQEVLFSPCSERKEEEGGKACKALWRSLLHELCVCVIFLSVGPQGSGSLLSRAQSGLFVSDAPRLCRSVELHNASLID